MEDLPLPTEPIGSIPRPRDLVAAAAAGDGIGPEAAGLYEQAVRDTIRAMEETGSPVVTDGEQGKYHNFWTYPVHGLPNTAPDGFAIPFRAGHVRRMLRLVRGPFRYGSRGDQHLAVALRYAERPVKQAVISPSALSLMYPAEGIPGYAREEFLEHLLQEHVAEVRACLALGAHRVQIDFTEGRLALKMDPTGRLLHGFLELIELGLGRLTPAERQRVGIHTCPGGDRDSTHSADVDYADLLPPLLQLRAGSFYIALAGEADPRRVLSLIRDHLRGDQRIFVGVVSPIDPAVETPEVIRDRLLLAARYIPPDQLGSTDDCGFAPFCDDASTSREVAFAKIRARVQGTGLAAAALWGRQ